uniref:Tetratricopeptide repeat protein 1 n=1 Tax=Ascaris suum TaxID=6253 RepID=F1L6C2_ASCSU
MPNDDYWSTSKRLVVDRMAQTLFNNAAHIKEDSSSAGEETGPDLKEENDSSMEKEDGPGGSEVTEQRSDAEAKEKEPNEGIRDNSGAVHGEGSNNGNTNGDSEKRLETERRERESVLTEEERIQRKDESGKIKNEGNRKFGEGSWQEAIELYTKALERCPLVYTSERAVYLSNRAACHIKLSDWDAAIKDCTEAIKLGAPNDKPLERRAHCYAQTEENYDNALHDYDELIKKYPDKKVYVEKAFSLKRAIDERNERIKQDMLAKLKDLGNMCLRPFGLSTDNFQLTPKPDGGYSISMRK